MQRREAVVHAGGSRRTYSRGHRGPGGDPSAHLVVRGRGNVHLRGARSQDRVELGPDLLACGGAGGDADRVSDPVGEYRGAGRHVEWMVQGVEALRGADSEPSGEISPVPGHPVHLRRLQDTCLERGVAYRRSGESQAEGYLHTVPSVRRNAEPGEHRAVLRKTGPETPPETRAADDQVGRGGSEWGRSDVQHLPPGDRGARLEAP